MYKSDTPAEKRITVLADKGYQGMEKTYTGINLVVPEKKKPNRELTDRQKRRNIKISKKRIIVEHSIGRIKQWARMRGPYDGTIEDFALELSVASGFVNFQLLWDAKRKRPRLDY